MSVMNVVVIACNALHLGFLGPYGNSWIETPHLDRLAAEGVVFTNHFPENLTTLPTRRSWWSGRYGFADPDMGWTPLRGDERILPDMLFDQGVRTALISDVPFLRDRDNGFGRGFDDVIWVRGSGYDPFIPASPAKSPVPADEPGFPTLDEDDPDRDLWNDRWTQYLRNREALRFHEQEEQTGVARVVSETIGWLDRHANDARPFLAWVDLFSPHGPWDPPVPYRDQYAAAEPDEFEADEEGDLVEEEGDDLSLEDVKVLIDVPPGAVGDVLDESELLRLRRTYAGVVTMLDHQIGRLMDAMKRLGRLDDTLVVFTADQGEPLGEHGFVRRFRPWLYEELIHTPLIVRMPRGEFGGSRSAALVQTVDLLPTILSAMGLPPSEDAHGHDLLPVIRGETSRIRDYACLGMDGEEFAIRTPEWHLILPIEPDPEDPPRPPELYRKPEDRWDQNNIAAENAETAQRLELALRRFVDALARDTLGTLPPVPTGDD